MAPAGRQHHFLLETGSFSSPSSKLHQKLLHLQVGGRYTGEGGEIFRFDFIEMHDSSCEIGMGLIFRLVAKQAKELKVW